MVQPQLVLGFVKLSFVAKELFTIPFGKSLLHLDILQNTAESQIKKNLYSVFLLWNIT